MNSIVKSLALGAMMALVGCAANPVAPPMPIPTIVYKTKEIDSGCSWTSLIKIVDEDVLTKGTADQILAHDLAYKKHCGSGLTPK